MGEKAGTCIKFHRFMCKAIKMKTIEITFRIKYLKVLFLIAPFVLFISPSSAFAEEDRFSFSIEGNTGDFKGPKTSYLGTQLSGGPNNFDLVKPESGKHMDSVRASFSGKPSTLSNIMITGAFDYGLANETNNIGFIDTAGNNLLISGVIPGTGYFFPNVNNEIFDARYNSSYQYYGFETKIQKQIDIKNSKIQFEPFLGISYRDADIDYDFGGNIPGFNARFQYNTDINIQTISPLIGAKIAYPITSKITWINSAQYSYDFNHGNGQDRLNYQDATLNNTQIAKIGSNDHTHSYRLRSGFEYDVNDKFSIALEGQYQRLGNIPEMDLRTDINISDFDYGHADIFTGSLTAKYKF